ncbi:Na(+)/H(+) antiporter subunit F1 [Jeotgalicoccus huakuii]|uniref:Na(+)/H(+) antiporter subunit F1 n=1 Tax=Jeotgalicoccus TaxID=227979 RepID=UPI00041176D2|nr:MULTISPECIES: Na(+)/H(+) antiporter subunit F1 [Jeotgalicoccus]MCK1976334.1 Na(+)/H(+) antiporter subunit F1 [Jeotgalicoccus huakuii]QQD85950.1 Na(+)/H(+) antiporter subunit F1 [Jeotgalicoccus sp. ATCC 8456]
MTSFVYIIVIFSIIVFAITMLGMLYRTIKGPTLHDRVVTLDAFGVTLMGMIGLLSIVLETTYLLPIIMLIGMVGFIGTVGFAKFLEKGVIIENDRDNNS